MIILKELHFLYIQEINIALFICPTESRHQTYNEKFICNVRFLHSSIVLSKRNYIRIVELDHITLYHVDHNRIYNLATKI